MKVTIEFDLPKDQGKYNTYLTQQTTVEEIEKLFMYVLTVSEEAEKSGDNSVVDLCLNINRKLTLMVQKTSISIGCNYDVLKESYLKKTSQQE